MIKRHLVTRLPNKPTANAQYVGMPHGPCTGKPHTVLYDEKSVHGDRNHH